MATIETLLLDEYVQFFLILLGTVVFANISNFVLKNYTKKIVEKTKTKTDDVIFEIGVKQIYLFIILIGTYAALKTLSILDPYTGMINGIFFVVFVVIIAHIASQTLTVFISDWLKVQRRFKRTPQLISKIITITIYIIAFLMVLSYFKLEISPLIATLGIGAIAVGLALQNTLTNFFAGLHLISDRPIEVGDFIELEGDISGYIEDIGWRSTRIRTIRSTIIIIPNSKLAESTITNDSLPEQEIAVYVDCGVAYESDLKKVEAVTIDVARQIQKTVQGAVKEFEPFIRYRNFGDSHIDFRVILRVEDPVVKYLVVHEFIKALKEKYDKEGIEISWPVRKIYHRE